MPFIVGRRNYAYVYQACRTGKEIEVDSAGISSHQGELADDRMRAHAIRRGYNITHRSRPVRTDDFYEFDLILGMDDRNIDALKEKAPDVETERKIGRMTDYCRVKVVDYVPGLKDLKMYLTYWKMLAEVCSIA